LSRAGDPKPPSSPIYGNQYAIAIRIVGTKEVLGMTTNCSGWAMSLIEGKRARCSKFDAPVANLIQRRPAGQPVPKTLLSGSGWTCSTPSAHVTGLSSRSYSENNQTA
jgi:hypothetical protein